MHRKYHVNSIKETLGISKKITKLFTKKIIVFLNGNLGSGKTQIAKGIIETLTGIKEVTSPTFSLVNEYYAEVTVFHFDLYRIEKFDENFWDWFDEFINRDSVVLIEWGEKIISKINRNYIKIDIEKDLNKSENFRKITVTKVNK